MGWRFLLLRFFLWVSVIAWGVVLGAKLFDLRVVAGAWSAAPPESLSLLPYGPRFPVNPGQFFAPISATILLAALAALIAGWNTPNNYRVWLALSAGSILAVWIFTVVAFWPRNGTLFAAGSGSPIAQTDRADLIRQARLWVRYDWCRIAMMVVGYMAAVRAISMPTRNHTRSPERVK
jgi:hypothetical protein